MANSTLASSMLRLEKQEIDAKQRSKTTKRAMSASHANRKQAGKVLIAGHFDPEVRAALFLVQALKQYRGRSLQDILGEAINDLCSKNRVTRPYKLDRPVE